VSACIVIAVLNGIEISHKLFTPEMVVPTIGLPKPWRDRRDRYSVCFARPVCLRGRSICHVCQ